jgi:integrase
MVWDEIDFDARIWTVPATRMKTKMAHRVPLSDRAIEVLAAQRATHGGDNLVFPAPRGGVLSDMALTAFLRRNKVRSGDAQRFATAHGFRSSFRDWAAEGGYSREIAERALAHTVTSKVEAAYNRTDLLEQRRAMMAAWSTFVAGDVSAPKVVPIRSSRTGSHMK